MPISQKILDKLAANSDDIVGLNLTLEVDSDEDVIRLVNALRKNTYLRSLTIQGHWNKPSITDKGARLLSSCRRLTFLDLSYHKNITNSGAEAFAHHPSLDTLFFRGCSVTPAGLLPFLENDVLIDLRIAASASPHEQEGEPVKAKLKENKVFWNFRYKLKFLSAKDLNVELYQWMNTNPNVVRKLPDALQVDAEKDPREWEDEISTGLILANNLAKLKGLEDKNLVKFAVIFAERYKILREERQNAGLYKKAKVDVDVEEASPSRGMSPDI